MDPKEHYQVQKESQEAHKAAQIAADKARALEMLMRILENNYDPDTNITTKVVTNTNHGK